MKKDIGRNDPCPCGSGKKYKKCCMGDDELGDSSEFESKYRFEAGSYGDTGSYMPSIACLRLMPNGNWDYYFVLVNPSHVLSEEDEALALADYDLSRGGSGNGGGLDAALAMELKDEGYINVDDFNVAGGGFQA